MELEAKLVSRLPGASSPDAPRSRPVPGSPAACSQRSTSLARAVVDGMARLIEGQRQLADEFGLSLARVFPRSVELLEGRSPEDALTELFRSGAARTDELQALFEDMIVHQLALVGALDGIALAAMQHLSPEQLKEDYPERRMSDARAWRYYKERLRDLVENDNLRFQGVVGTGFVNGYLQAREKHEVKPESVGS